MLRRTAMWWLAAGIPAVAAAADAQRVAAENPLSRQVRDLALAYEAAWNAGDMTAMAALYTAEVHWVNIMGMHWQGRADVDFAHRALFDRTFKGIRSKLDEIESIKPLPGGGAVAVVRWSVDPYTAPSGQAFPASRTRMSLTLVRERGKLLIAHGANIQIVEAAQRSDPVRLREEREGG